jgi:hypothetical protein
VAGTLACLPSLLTYVFAGAAVKTGLSVRSGGENSIRMVLLVLGTLAMAILAIQVARVLRRVAPGATSAVNPGAPQLAPRPDRRG